jgi:hypothetical protein
MMIMWKAVDSKHNFLEGNEEAKIWRRQNFGTKKKCGGGGGEWKKCRKQPIFRKNVRGKYASISPFFLSLFSPLGPHQFDNSRRRKAGKGLNYATNYSLIIRWSPPQRLLLAALVVPFTLGQGLEGQSEGGWEGH